MRETAELPPDKLYFSIGEVAEMFGVNQSHLRYWEKEFPIIQPKKNRKGNRMFSRQDLENIRLIYHLTREKGYTIEGARRVIEHQKDDVEKIAEVIARLKHIKSELLEIREKLGKQNDS
ncbi:MAG: MerR family transcriptional regulator [Cryomorphaceae bacterium]|nr:MerR family transcriptional regulator [Cryomorphaceae bacterium]